MTQKMVSGRVKVPLNKPQMTKTIDKSHKVRYTASSRLIRAYRERTESSLTNETRASLKDSGKREGGEVIFIPLTLLVMREDILQLETGNYATEFPDGFRE